MVDCKNRRWRSVAAGNIRCCGGMVRPMNQAKKIRKALMKAVSDCDRLEIRKVLKRLEMEKNRWKNGKLNSIGK